MTRDRVDGEPGPAATPVGLSSGRPMTHRPNPAAPVATARRRAAQLAGGLGQGFLAFRVPNYRRFWIGNILSLVGSAMQSVSLPWLVLLLGGTPVELGIVAAMQFTPSLVLSSIGGAIADRVVLLVAGWRLRHLR